jgi:hypothetical protein
VSAGTSRPLFSRRLAAIRAAKRIAWRVLRASFEIFAGYVERGAVIHRRADPWNAERDVHCDFKVDQFHVHMPLVVVTGDTRW